MKIVIPMVGRGIRVKDEYGLPKPLVRVEGKTIAEHSVSSLGIDGDYVFIVREFSEYPNGKALTGELCGILRELKPHCEIVKIDYVTEGPASSVLLAKEFINNDSPLVVTNCDQLTLWDPEKFLSFASKTEACVVTYHRPDIVVGQKSPYSFIRVDQDGNGVEFREKFAISDLAFNGIHYWSQGKMFVESAEAMIKDNVRVNNEFYVSETFNYLLSSGVKVRYYPMNQGEFYALGDSSEIRLYKNLVDENS